jgi:hypothetical protein
MSVFMPRRVEKSFLGALPGKIFSPCPEGLFVFCYALRNMSGWESLKSEEVSCRQNGRCEPNRLAVSRGSLPLVDAPSRGLESGWLSAPPGSGSFYLLRIRPARKLGLLKLTNDDQATIDGSPAVKTDESRM